MQVSVNSPLARYVRVLVDGVDVTARCYRADTQRGIAMCHKRGENSRFVINRDRGRTVREAVCGKVEINLVENAPAWAVRIFNELKSGGKS